MRVSVVLRSRDEADRLRLTLTSLVQQGAYEVIVVDDGSRDHTPDIIAEAAQALPLVSIRHERSKGRSAASNAGAFAARGEILLFLDGDTLAGPGLVAAHRRAHGACDRLIGRGETFNLRCTRFLSDPETATPWPSEEARLASLSAIERERMKVTRHQVLNEFDAIAERSAPGIYPGFAPQKLYELEIDALVNHPDCSVLWAAASGHNLSVRRAAFVAAGGFAEKIDINEHRELALRLTGLGETMGFVNGARAYHLTHRSGWRDPLADADWEGAFLARHPLPEVKLLAVLWASLARPSPVPREAQLHSLPDLEAAARGETRIDYDAVRSLILAKRGGAAPAA